MVNTIDNTRMKASAPVKMPVATLPSRMKVLYITTLHRTGGWLAEAFASDSATDVHLLEAVGVTAGMARLRDEVFDAILISHETEALDALDLVEGLRAGGTEEPVIVLGAQSEQEMAPLCFEVGADGYCCVSTSTTRTLIWLVARAIERFQLIRENRRLLQADRQRLDLEHQEAQRLLHQQRSLISQLKTVRRDWPQDQARDAEQSPLDDELSRGELSRGELSRGELSRGELSRGELSRGELSRGELSRGEHTRGELRRGDPQVSEAESFFDSLPTQLVSHYREMLRAYVIMGAGNLSQEMASLASLLARAGVTSRQTMQLHLHVLEELIRGLGNRSARHVMNRADLLVLEVMIHLAEGYRRQYLQRIRPLRQLPLPGFAPGE